MWNDFKVFALRGNVVDMAVGIIVGGAFGTIAKSLVEDVLMPPIGLLLGNVDFADLFFVLRPGEPAGPYATVSVAQEAGAVTLNYGIFINNVISFLIVAFAVFLAIRVMNNLRREEEEAKKKEPTDKECPYCFTSIPVEAKRCPNCTSELAPG